MLGKSQDQFQNKEGNIIFWILWVLAFVLFPLYAFTLIFDLNTIKENSQIVVMIGVAVLVAQIAILIISLKQMKRKLGLYKPYFTLLCGTSVVGLVWATRVIISDLLMPSL